MIISYCVLPHISEDLPSFGSINFVERPAPEEEWRWLHSGASDCVMIVPGTFDERDLD